MQSLARNLNFLFKTKKFMVIKLLSCIWYLNFIYGGYIILFLIKVVQSNNEHYQLIILRKLLLFNRIMYNY